MPSALAVFRFITSSCLVGACTGRSLGLLALEDAVDIASRAAVLVDKIRPVGDQAAGRDEIACGVDRRNAVASNHRSDQIALRI